jgi:hypothetical protein
MIRTGNVGFEQRIDLRLGGTQGQLRSPRIWRLEKTLLLLLRQPMASPRSRVVHSLSTTATLRRNASRRAGTIASARSAMMSSSASLRLIGMRSFPVARRCGTLATQFDGSVGPRGPSLAAPSIDRRCAQRPCRDGVRVRSAAVGLQPADANWLTADSDGSNAALLLLILHVGELERCPSLVRAAAHNDIDARKQLKFYFNAARRLR